MSTRMIWLLTVLSLLPTIAAADQVASLTTSVPEAIAPAASAEFDNQIGVHDTLQIDVFDVPALSGPMQVDNAGTVNLPLIGQVQAAGKTPNQLAKDIASALSAKYMKDPIVTVAVKDAASKKITVDGSVVQPGVYQIGPSTTLMQAVALAHGPDQVADVHHVAIIRAVGANRAMTVYDLDDIREGKQTDPTVRPDDEIVVDSSGARKFVRDFGSLFSVIGLLHP